MKRTGFVVCMLLAFIFLMGAVSSTRAAGMKIGAMGWYAWWDSDYNKFHTSGKAYPLTFRNKFESNSAPLYGPVLSFDVSKWSLNFIFLFGTHYRVKGEYANIGVTSSAFGLTRGKGELLKYDFDTTLSYAFTKVFKLFLGFKVNGYDNESTGDYVGIESVEEYPDGVNKMLGYGPGLGIGVTVPIVNNLYLLWNGSALYTRTDLKGRKSAYGVGTYTMSFNGISSTSPFMWQSHKYNAALNGVGANTGLSLAFLVPSASLTFSLGGRYQFIKYYVAKGDVTVRKYTSPIPAFNAGSGYVEEFMYNRGLKKIMHNRNDHFYGITLSVISSIDFERKNESEN